MRRPLLKMLCLLTFFTLMQPLHAEATAAAGAAAAGGAKKKQSLPNILWITCEDIGPHLGCYGDDYATTPNLDAFAKRSLLYKVAWSNAPVCAPARTTIISGIYPPSSGGQHMRSTTNLPDSMQMFVCYLRALGYYCTNNSKEDYNLNRTGRVWDESSGKAHYKNRKAGQPFFAVFNFTVSHESQLRRRPHKQVHDPAKVPIPAYHPDTPEVRQDWAQYHDKITDMDKLVGKLLRELEALGLAENTIVIFYSDHGSGMPRNKRWPYNSGLHVPFIVHVPAPMREQYAPRGYATGGTTNRMVSFVDLAPSMLSLAGQRPPEWMQGSAFLGKYAEPPRKYLYGFRGRMDERYDMVRSVRDDRYVYVRNYMPHKIQGQYLDYMWQTPTTRVWESLFLKGKLNAAQSAFWTQPRPPEELYDLTKDPDEVNNLAKSPDHQDILKRLRKVHREHVFRIRDLGFLPESEIHGRSKGSTPYEMGHDPSKYPLERIERAADLASMLQPEGLAELQKMQDDEDSAVRYWATLGILMRGKQVVLEKRDMLLKALGDPAPQVRIVAAEALGRFGKPGDLQPALTVFRDTIPVKNHGVYVSMQALNAVGELGAEARPLLPVINKAAEGTNAFPQRVRGYVPRLVGKLRTDLK